MNLTAEQLASIDAQLFAGDIIAAIRLHRRYTDTQLINAKSFVDHRVEHLRSLQPSKFPETSTPPQPDPQILSQITPLPAQDLHKLRSTLTRIEELLPGLNYVAILDVSAATIPNTKLPFNELMLSLYPASVPHDATIMKVSSVELVNDVNECLKYAGRDSAGPQFTDRRFKELTDTLLPQFWQQLNSITPLESALLYSYSSDVGLPGYYVFWFYAYLLHCPETNRCVVITGTASD